MAVRKAKRRLTAATGTQNPNSEKSEPGDRSIVESPRSFLVPKHHTFLPKHHTTRFEIAMKRSLLSLAKRIARPLMRIDLIWEITKRFPRHEFFMHVRNSVVHKNVRQKIAPVLQSLEVQQGPFAGLRYAETSSVGSTLWPKLMGTYESELLPTFQEIRNRNYDSIVDVGYAEGFYLIGLGRLFGDAKLVGFDVEPEAQRLCRLNANVNGISAERLQLLGGFDADDFETVLDRDALVVVDCEGFENEVIDSVSCEQIARADWLIETHDHLVNGTTEKLRQRLVTTHDVVEVETDEDFETKRQLLPAKVRDTCNRYEQEAIVTEGRLAKQSWIFATRRAA